MGGRGELGSSTEWINEGKVKILAPRLEGPPKKAPVFYNPAMELSRDLSVLAVRCYRGEAGRDLKACDAMAATGVRGIRFAVEAGGVERVVLNDVRPSAYRLIKINVEENGVKDVCEETNMDANALLSLRSRPKDKFDVVDLDPFGSPAPFLDSAVRGLREGGMLALTATDMAPLCGAHPSSTLRKYGGFPLRTEYCHEIAVRLLIGCLASTAAKHDVGVEILFSHATDHYVRVYAVSRRGATAANESVKKMGVIAHCFNCLHRSWLFDYFGGSPRCKVCGGRLSYAGPLWLGEIADRKFCERMLKELEGRGFRLEGKERKLLERIVEEAGGPPTYYAVEEVCGKLSLPPPRVEEVVSRLREKGFFAVRTHFKGSGVKTDADIGAVEEAVKELSGKA